MSVCGIDPGHRGAVAYLDGDIVEIVDAPTMEISGRTFADLVGMYRVLKGYAAVKPHVFIERVHSMPGSSGASMFTFGLGYGAWQMAAVCLDFPLTRVEPARWKAAMLDGMGKEKDASRFRAALLFPKYAHLFARKSDDGRAEALLIAEYGRRTLK